MKLYEFVLDDMGISEVTQNAMEKDGVGKVYFIKAIVENNALEILIEVESSHDKARHVDLKGNEKTALGYGYVVIVRFEKIDEVLKGDPLSRKNIQEVMDVCEVKVHCDCPAFYWQGMHQDDSANNTAKYKFQGTGGKHLWTMIHADAGGKTGQALCKHLHTAVTWLKDHMGVIEDYLKLEEIMIKKYKPLVEAIRHKYLRLVEQK